MKKLVLPLVLLVLLGLATLVGSGCCTFPGGLGPLPSFPGTENGGQKVEKSGFWILNNLEAAEAQAKKEGKLVLIDFWADW